MDVVHLSVVASDDALVNSHCWAVKEEEEIYV
jgi:hypothetical protein